MNAQQALQAQYPAALKMLKEAVNKCPADLWEAPEDRDPVWFKAQHALYWTQRYLRSADKRFVPGRLHKKPEASAAAPKQQVLEYLQSIEQQLIENLDAPTGRTASNRGGMGLDKLELHLINIRHLQQHAGELYERLGARARVTLHWTETVHRRAK
jgi:hypothetical protein